MSNFNSENGNVSQSFDPSISGATIDTTEVHDWALSLTDENGTVEYTVVQSEGGPLLRPNKPR